MIIIAPLMAKMLIGATVLFFCSCGMAVDIWRQIIWMKCVIREDRNEF